MKVDNTYKLQLLCNFIPAFLLFLILKVECDKYLFTTEQILPWSVLASLISTVFLLEDKWKASKITKIFVWPLTILLCFHWTFDLTSRRMKGEVNVGKI